MSLTRPVTRIIFDLHGVLFERSVAKGQRSTAEIVNHVRNAGITVAFVTNSSTLFPFRIAATLAGMGIAAAEQECVSAGWATALFLQRFFPGHQIVFIGQPGFRYQIEHVCGPCLTEAHSGKSTVVVVGRDPCLSHAKLEAAAEAGRSGAALIATSRDRSFPCEGTVHPGPWETVHAIETVMGTSATIVGKPQDFMLREVLRWTSEQLQETLIVGDSAEQDVALGKSVGASTALILGDRGHFPGDDLSPDVCLSDLEEMLPLLGIKP